MVWKFRKFEFLNFSIISRIQIRNTETVDPTAVVLIVVVI